MTVSHWLISTAWNHKIKLLNFLNSIWWVIDLSWLPGTLILHQRKCWFSSDGALSEHNLCNVYCEMQNTPLLSRCATQSKLALYIMRIVIGERHYGVCDLNRCKQTLNKCIWARMGSGRIESKKEEGGLILSLAQHVSKHSRKSGNRGILLRWHSNFPVRVRR